MLYPGGWQSRCSFADSWSFRIIELDGAELRFVRPTDGRGEGLGAFDVAVRNPAEVRSCAQARGCIDEAGNIVLCGTRVRLVEA